MKRALLIAGMLVGGSALAGGRHGGSGISFVPSRPYANFYVSTPLVQQPVVAWPYFTWYYTVPQAPPPPPPPQPTVVYVEREPAPPPQVIVIPQPAPVIVEVPAAAPPPSPVAAPPAPPAPVVPAGPRTPGPDVFAWTDEDGVVNYSTRAPANAQVKAKKLATLAK